MNEIVKLALLFSLGLIAGFINVMAGGGSTLTLPVLIFLGLEGSLANGTNRVAIMIQNLSAIISFKREKYEKFRLSLKLSAFALPGAIVGALISVKISNELFQTILAFVMMGIIITLILPNSKKEMIGENFKYNPWYVYAAMFGIGFYGGFIQAGVGFIIMAALHHLMRLNLVNTNMHKVFIICFYTIPAIIVLAVT